MQFKSCLMNLHLPWNESSLTNKICRPSNLIKYLSTLLDFSQAINASSANLFVVLSKLWFFFFLSDLDFFFCTGLTRVTWLVGLMNVCTIQSHGLAWKEKVKEKRKSRDTPNSIPKSITCLSVTLWLMHLDFIYLFIKFLCRSHV